MTRVASIPMQRTLFDALQKSQQQVAKSQLELATHKKVTNYADLGTEAVRTLSAHSLLARQDAQGNVIKQLDTTLAIQDAHISNIESSTETLRVAMLNVIGSGDGSALQEAIDATFQDVRAALNGDEGGIPLFAGSQTDKLPFTPTKLSDLVGKPVADAFRNDDVRAAARVSDGLDLEYGVHADELGTKFMEGFKALAEMGPIGAKPTQAQMDALAAVVKQFEGGLSDVRAVNAENGRKQAQIDTLGDRAEDRELLLKDLIGRSEDADLGQVAMELTTRKTALEASYSVFSQLSSLSLVRFLN